MLQPNTIATLSRFTVTIFTVIFFNLVAIILRRLPLPRTVEQTKDDYKIFRFRNFIVSWLHACITGIIAWGIIAIYYTEMWADRVGYANTPLYFLSCFSAGYFIYDSLDIITSGHIREKWEVLLHHICVMSCAIYCVVTSTCLPYQCLLKNLINFIHIL